MFPMILSRIFSLAAACLFPLSASGQEEAAVKLSIRAFLNDPAHPETQLFVHDAPEHLVPLVLAPGELPAAQVVTAPGGKLRLYSFAKFDPANPDAALVASASVPKNLKQAITIIQPRGDGGRPPCGIVLVDDEVSSFRPGESRVISFTTLPIAMQAGEHKIAIASGKVTAVPPVAQVDPYNMAQTNFLYKSGEAWVPFSEAKMKYLKEYRQVFLCVQRPGGKSPTLVTLVDDIPKAPAP